VVDEVIMWFRFAGISADRADAIKNFIWGDKRLLFEIATHPIDAVVPVRDCWTIRIE
jgi:hypothetical protein